MVIKTETVNIDVTLPDGGELPEGLSFVVFELTANDVDVGDNQVIPSRPIEVELDADGLATASLWPNDRGERGTFYRVSVVVKDERGIAQRSKTYRYGLAQFEDGGGPYDLAAEVFDGLTPEAFGTIKLQARVLLPNGTTAIPALAFADQPNTGLSRPAASVLALSTNGSERARVTNAGLQVAGLLTGTAVTQSPTDTTPGRLIRTQDGYVRGSAIGTVSESGGVPTGAIIQRGSNSNGDFVRYADGTQICWGVYARSGVSISAAFAGGFRNSTDSGNGTFPAAFVDNEVRISGLVNDIITSEGVPMWARSLFGGTELTVRFWRVTSATDVEVNAQWIAIGRWF